MYSYRKLFLPRLFAFGISKNINNVNKKSVNKNGYRQYTTQFKRDFNYENLFDNFKKQWFLKLTSIGILGGIVSCKSVRVYCQEFSMEDIEEKKVDLKPIELNESSDLTHTNLLRAAGRVCTDGALQLLHRSTAACIDKSEHYRKSLNKVMDLLEYCITIISDQNQHDELWPYVIAARHEMEATKQQLSDLKILFDYSCLTLENASMAAFISGAEFSASISQNLITSAKHELSNEESKIVSLENQYTSIVSEHVRALSGYQASEALPEGNDQVECDTKEGNSDKTIKPQTQEDNSKRLLYDDLIPSQNNEEHTIIEDQSKDFFNVDEENNCNIDNQNIDKNKNNSKENISENFESNWMSGFSEFVEYEDKEDEEVLSF